VKKTKYVKIIKNNLKKKKKKKKKNGRSTLKSFPKYSNPGIAESNFLYASTVDAEAVGVASSPCWLFTWGFILCYWLRLDLLGFRVNVKRFF